MSKKNSNNTWFPAWLNLLPKVVLNTIYNILIANKIAQKKDRLLSKYRSFFKGKIVASIRDL